MARAPLHAKTIAAAEKKVAEAEEAKEAAWRAVKHLVVHCWTAEYERRKTEAITMLDGLFAFGQLYPLRANQLNRTLLPKVKVLKNFLPFIEGLKGAKSETDPHCSDGVKLDEYVALLLDGKFPA